MLCFLFKIEELRAAGIPVDGVGNLNKWIPKDSKNQATLEKLLAMADRMTVPQDNIMWIPFGYRRSLLQFLLDPC